MATSFIAMVVPDQQKVGCATLIVNMDARLDVVKMKKPVNLSSKISIMAIQFSGSERNFQNSVANSSYQRFDFFPIEI